MTPEPDRLLRILENPTATLCYVNAFILALAWSTLLTNSLQPHLWHGGYELMKGATQWNLVPLNLLTFGPLLWLLHGGWSEDDLRSQHDILEFGTFLLSQTRPEFICCSWTTRFQFATGISHPHLDGENGQRHSPIILRFDDHHADKCKLSELLSLWHDCSGLCRAGREAGRCMIIGFDRHLEDTHRKCTQMICMDQDYIQFPFFCNADGDIDHRRFDLAAVTFHIGTSPNSGHYRTAVRYKGRWFVYEDNRLPDQIPTLTEDILRNCTMFWYVLHSSTDVRNMTAPPSRLPLPMPLLESPIEDNTMEAEHLEHPASGGDLPEVTEPVLKCAKRTQASPEPAPPTSSSTAMAGTSSSSTCAALAACDSSAADIDPPAAD